MRRSHMASSRQRPSARMGRLAGSVVVVALIALALWWAARAVPGAGPPVTTAGLVAAVLLVVLFGLVVAATWLFTWPAAAPNEPVIEEPWFAQPNLPAGRGVPRVLSICGLAPGAGSSTIALNLALHVACEGLIGQGDERRRPRTLALLQEGDLTRRLNLSPEPLQIYFEAHPVSADDSLVELAARHPAGCEVLCLASGLLHAHRLRLLLEAVREHYDLVVIDCPTADPWLAESAARLAAFTLLVGGPACESAAIAAAETVWRRGSEGRVGLLLNRVAGSFRLPAWVGAAFVHWAVLPEDPVVLEADGAGHPWALRQESRARRALAEIATTVLPDLLRQEAANAA